MSTSNILGGSEAPQHASGTDTDALGPSDSSDSGSDVQGELPMATDPDEPDEMGAVPVDLDSNSDAGGTGERGSAVSENAPDAPDSMPDRIIPASGQTLDESAADDVSELASDAEGSGDEGVEDEEDERGAGGIESPGEPRGTGRRDDNSRP